MSVLLRGVRLYGEGDQVDVLVESQGLYEVLMGQDPDDTLAIAGEVRALSAQRQYAATLEAVKAALEKAASDWRAHARQAATLMRNHVATKTNRAAKKAIG